MLQKQMFNNTQNKMKKDMILYIEKWTVISNQEFSQTIKMI